MFDLVYLDPPYHYNSRKAGDERNYRPTKFGGGAEKHYPLMKDPELIELGTKIQGWFNPNCIMFLWVPCPRLDFGIELVKSWGFRYCTVGFVWVKISQDGNLMYGPGYYTASNAELVLIGVRGSMPPTVPMIQQVVEAMRREHSRKPDEVRKRIERMYPNTKKLEMFARERHPLWHAWGNEITVENGEGEVEYEREGED